MNPHLSIFFRGLLIFLLSIAVIAAIVTMIILYAEITFEELSGYILTGILYVTGVIGGGIVLFLIVGIMMKEVFTNIFCRADHILIVSEDSKNGGVHIITDHYYSGGDGDGYYGYCHYFIEFSKGKLFLSRNMKTAEDTARSIEDLTSITKRNLSINLNDKFVSPASSGNGVDTIKINLDIKFSEYKFNIREYDNLIDYGFKILCYTNSGNLLWKKKI
jgi:hypothetical protein